MPVRLIAIVFCAFLADGGGDRAVDVAAVARDGHVYVSSTASDALMRDLEEAIQSGLATTITYETDLREEVGIWFDRLPLFSTDELEPNAEYYVRVRVRTRPRVTFFFWPWGRDAASGVARFTFIP